MKYLQLKTNYAHFNYTQASKCQNELSIADNLLYQYVISIFIFYIKHVTDCSMERAGYFLDLVILVFVIKEVYRIYLPFM